MPSKKKKYNARFPAGRIKKIMQTDEEVGKVAQAVPVIISRTLELFVESLLTKSAQITQTRNAKTLTPSHMKQCILSESRFDFLKDLVKNIPDASVQEDNENNAIYEANLVQMNESEVGSDGGGSGVLQNDTKQQQSTIEIVNKPIIAAANFYTEQQSTSTSRTPVILYGPKVTINRQTSESSSPPAKRSNLSANNSEKNHRDEPQTLQIATTIGSSSSTIVPVPPLIPTKNSSSSTEIRTNLPICNETTPPPLIPISHNNNSFAQNTDDSLCIDEDYDN